MTGSGSRFFASPIWRDGVKLLCWVPVGVFFTRHGYSMATVTGASMQPTFNPNHTTAPLHHDVVLLDRWSIALNIYERGEVVTLWSPQNPKLLTTKRIVALEGDLVHPLPPSSPSPVRIPPGHCWVEGDSHFHSKDSNTYGPVPLGLINGKVAHILWPLNRFGPVGPGTVDRTRIRTFPIHRHA